MAVCASRLRAWPSQPSAEATSTFHLPTAGSLLAEAFCRLRPILSTTHSIRLRHWPPTSWFDRVVLYQVTDADCAPGCARRMGVGTTWFSPPSNQDEGQCWRLNPVRTE